MYEPMAVIGSQAVNGPVVRRAGCGVGVPELDLRDLALEFSAAGVLDGDFLVAV